MVRNIVLVGMMGAGKSTVGAIIADRLERTLVETDALVEARVGRTIPEIFDVSGEPSFRELEEEAVRYAATGNRKVISAGGGAVLSDANLAALRATGVLVLLDAPAPVLAARVADTDFRPLVTGDAGASLETILDDRRPRYEDAADLRVDADATPDDVANRVLTALSSRDDVLSAAERERLA